MVILYNLHSMSWLDMRDPCDLEDYTGIVKADASAYSRECLGAVLSKLANIKEAFWQTASDSDDLKTAKGVSVLFMHIQISAKSTEVVLVSQTRCEP